MAKSTCVDSMLADEGRLGYVLQRFPIAREKIKK